MIFTLNGQADSENDLFTDFTRRNGKYTFVFPRHAYRGGTDLTFAVRARMTEGGETGRLAAVNLTFSGNRAPLDASFTLRKNGGRTPAANEPYVVAVTGDAAGGEPASARVLRLIRAWNPNLFLYTGDVYNVGTQAEYYNHYGLGNRLWGTLRGKTLPTIGNHESFYKPEGDDGFGYFNYWFRNNTSASSHRYSVDAHRGWHIVSLDSTAAYLGPAGGLATADEQLSFVENDLVGDARTGCSIGLYHHPLYTRGPEPSNAKDMARLTDIWTALASRGVDIVLNGHDHNYQRSKRLNANGDVRRNGTAQFVVGSGGHGIEPTERREDRIARVVDREGLFGALRLVLNQHGAEYRYVTLDGRIRDIGVIPCSDRRPDRQDNVRPTKPSLVAANKKGRNVTLRWRASTDVGGVGVTRYIVFRNGNRVGTTKRQTFTDRNAPRRLHRYTVKAVDYSGNTSRKSNVKQVWVR